MSYGGPMPGRAWFSGLDTSFREWRAKRVLERARRAKTREGAAAAVDVLMNGVASQPRSAELWNALCIAQIEREDFAGAERSARCAVEMGPASAEAHNNHGIAQAQLGAADLALASFERALQLDPGLAAAAHNRAGLLSKLQRFDMAIAAWDVILREASGDAEGYAARGVLLTRAGRFREARQDLERARALGSRDPFVGLHVALIEAAVGDARAAGNELNALRGQIEDAELDWNLALIELSRGAFAQAWPLYEARLRKSFESPRRAYPFPEWQGEPLPAGQLLVMAEQGLGDEIMFASCYGDVLRQAPGCIFECDPRLAGLFARSFPGASVAGVTRDNDRRWLKDYPGLRYQIHAGSLPRLFRRDRESFPRHSGYLSPDRQRVEAYRRRFTEAGTHLKVGIAWNGGLVQTRRALRCVPLEELSRLMRGTPHLYVSLQHDDDGTDARRLAELSGAVVRAFPDVLKSTDETAALVSALDVVITVCSTVVHLSGAVGAKTWVLTPDVPEWRYLSAGTELPWYSGTRLFRQTRSGTWSPVIDSVATELAALADSTGDGACLRAG